MGVTSAVFQSDGSSPVCRDWLKTAVRPGEISCASSLRIRAGILSGPDAFLTLRFKRSLATPGCDMWNLRIVGKGVPSSWGIASSVSGVKTDWNCSDSISALVVLSLCGVPPRLRGAIPTFSCLWDLTYLQKVLESCFFQTLSKDVVDVIYVGSS